jgi:fructokinase
MSIRIGIDLGGTKTEIVALADDGMVRLRERVSTPSNDYDATVAMLVRLVADTVSKVGAGGTAIAQDTPVGIGIPGAVSLVTGLIKNANSTCLIGRPLCADLETALGRPVRLANDANCFSLSEAADGAARGARSVMAVILGTGVGAGIVIDGKLLIGANAIAGEWGHNPMPGEQEQRACYCGRRDCIETYLSGPALESEYWRGRGNQLGLKYTAEQIARAAGKDDVFCNAIVTRFEERLARALALVINILDPEVIVLGGGLSNMTRLYENVPRLWARHVFSDMVATRLVPPMHGDSSGVRGAAWLWK